MKKSVLKGFIVLAVLLFSGSTICSHAQGSSFSIIETQFHIFNYQSFDYPIKIGSIDITNIESTYFPIWNGIVPSAYYVPGSSIEHPVLKPGKVASFKTKTYISSSAFGKNFRLEDSYGNILSTVMLRKGSYTIFFIIDEKGNVTHTIVNQ